MPVFNLSLSLDKFKFGANTVRYFGDNSLVWGEIWQGDAADWYFMDGYAPLVKHNDSGTYYYINDHLGTPILVTDESGNVVWKGEYDPFGKCTPTVAMIDNPIRFPGQYADAETGLHYNWHRYYDAGTGRYGREDPVLFEKEFKDINLYRYAFNIPNRLFDIEGLQCTPSRRDFELDRIDAQYDKLIYNHIFITEGGYFAWNNDCFFFAEITTKELKNLVHLKCCDIYFDGWRFGYPQGQGIESHWHNVVRVRCKCDDSGLSRFNIERNYDPYTKIMYIEREATRHYRAGKERGL